MSRCIWLIIAYAFLTAFSLVGAAIGLHEPWSQESIAIWAFALVWASEKRGS